MIHKQQFLSVQDRILLKTFTNLLQKCGNKQRALIILFNLLTRLRLGLLGYPADPKYPLKHISVKNPIELLKTCIYNLKPAFFIRRTIKSGRRYDLPVPITEKHATYLAIDWLKKAVLKNNKNGSPFALLLAQEISAVLYNEGSAHNYLKAYIDLALDQRPFLRFLKKRRYAPVKSKNTQAARKMKKIYGHYRKTSRIRGYRVKNIRRKLNKHDTRFRLKNFVRESIRKKNKQLRHRFPNKFYNIKLNNKSYRDDIINRRLRKAFRKRFKFRKPKVHYKKRRYYHKKFYK